MNTARWAEFDRVWRAVISRPEPERAAALEELCSGDESLRSEVESLLAHLARASAAGFGGAGAVSRAAGVSLIGRRLGPYTVHTLLGAGGMGDVYQARDTTLGREVAIKILPDPWLAGPELRARFEREARLLASLSHPNIAAIYGIHEGDDVRALVLELVEGETLAERIARGAARSSSPRGLPIADAVSLAGQLADAIEAAHERGIIHRDLKPANIKITPGGRTKVLDFGLARAATALGGDADSALGSAPPDGTLDGTLLGTAAYMSPEQARGRPVDARTDIWAFGCVLYEMLTGRQAFGSDSLAETLANVVAREPDWAALPAETPPPLRLCLRRCLQKDPRQRFHHIADVRLAMEGGFEEVAVPGGRGAAPVHRRAALTAYAGWSVAALAAVTALALAVGISGGRPTAPEVRLQITTPPAGDLLSLAIAPDGRSVVYQARATETGVQLWLRRLDRHDAEPLAGTGGGEMPFWSPNGRSVAFFSGGMLRRLDLATGAVRRLASAPDPRQGSWNGAGTIIFAAESTGPLRRVSAEGGPVSEATTLLPGQTSHRFPHFLPDGRRFLFVSLGTPEVRGLYLGSLDDDALHHVGDRESAYAFLPPDHLLVAREGALWARRLSRDHTRTQGDFIPVAQRVLTASLNTGYGSFSGSAGGVIAYRAAVEDRQLVWLDRSGNVLAEVVPPDAHAPYLHDLSADGRTAAVSRQVGGNWDVWIVDTERGSQRRLTFEPAVDAFPVFSPDGSRIAYSSDGPADVYQFYERRVDGSGAAELIYESARNKWVRDWSADGRHLLFSVPGLEGDTDLAVLSLEGAVEPFYIAETRFDESDGRFSPDGRWVAFTSNDQGMNQIYVQAFPHGPRRPVSSGVGVQPRWRRDGRELFYVGPGPTLMSVSIQATAGGIDWSAPRPLFAFPGAGFAGYAPAPDGQRFLAYLRDTHTPPIHVILNWSPPER